MDVKEVVKRDTSLRYDGKTGYLGTNVSTGTEVCKVTPYDRILIMRKTCGEQKNYIVLTIMVGSNSAVFKPQRKNHPI